MSAHVDDYGNPIHPPPTKPGDPAVEPPLSADLQEVADLLWLSAQGAPPLSEDPIALHFQDHDDLVSGCRMCSADPRFGNRTTGAAEAQQTPELDD